MHVQGQYVSLHTLIISFANVRNRCSTLTSKQFPSLSNAECTLGIETGPGSTIEPTCEQTLRSCSKDFIAPIDPPATPSNETGLPDSKDGKPKFSIINFTILLKLP